MCCDRPANREADLKDETITVEDVDTARRTGGRVNGAQHQAMRDAMSDVLPKTAPGLMASEIKDGVKPLLSNDLFPAGNTSGW